MESDLKEGVTVADDEQSASVAYVYWVIGFGVAVFIASSVCLVVAANRGMSLAQSVSRDTEKLREDLAMNADLQVQIIKGQAVLSDLNEDLDKRRVALRELEEGGAALRVREAQYREEVSGLSSRVDVLSKEASGLEARVDEYRGLVQRLDRAREQVKAGEAEIQEVDEALAVIRGQLVDLKKQKTILAASVEGLSGANVKLLASEIERGRIQESIESYNKKNEVLLQENKVLTKQYGDLKSRVLQAQRKLEEMFRYVNGKKGGGK